MPKTDLSVSPAAMWNLTWPQMLMMYLFFFSNIITIWVAGRLGPDVQAALGMVTQCTMFLMVVIMSISSGATAAISQSLGMGRERRARLYISTMVYGSIGLGVITAIPAWIFSSQILELVQLPAPIRPMGLEMWNLALIGLPLQYVFSATGVLFRSTRQVIPPLYVAALVCLCNFLGALGFGLGWFGLPAFGYMGLIGANVITQAIGALANCLLLSRSGYFHFSTLPTRNWLKKALPYLIRVALPAGAAQIVWQSGYLTLFVLVASLPKDSVSALAGLTAGLRAEALIFMPAMAFNMTCSVLVGNSLGEGKPEQARKAGLQLTGAAALGMSIFAACLWPCRVWIAHFLSDDPATCQQIVSYLSYNLLGTPFSIASQVMGGIMVGAGATRYNLIVYGGTFWAVRIPLGWLLGHKIWGTASGVFAAMVVSQIIQSAIMLYVVLYRNWPSYAMKGARSQKA